MLSMFRFPFHGKEWGRGKGEEIRACRRQGRKEENTGEMEGRKKRKKHITSWLLHQI